MTHRPSSLPMLAECPKFVGEGGEYAEAGTVRHAALSDNLADGNDWPLMLDADEEREGVAWAADYIRLHAPMSDYPLECEVKRTWTGPDFQDREGTPDVTCGPHIFDLKWRRRNYDAQMADYALSLFERGHEVVTVHILFAAFKQKEVFTLTQADAERIVGGILARAEDTKAEPAPCDYCGWCERRLTCSALLERANTIAEHREDWALESYHASEIVTEEQMGKALKLARALAKWCEAVEHFAKKQVDNGLMPVGFKTQNRQGNRFIASVIDAFGKVGLDQGDFLHLCKLGFTDLVEFHASKQGIPKRAAEREMESRLGDVLQRKAPSVSLVSVKEKE
jgi:hypothetical protein